MNWYPLIGHFWYFIIIVIIIAIFKSPWFKGVMGEFIVNISANFFLDKKQYHLIRNVTLPTKDGTTQIDHIIVSKFGIFVIETKNMKGWIFGSPNQRMWTQKIFKSTKRFQNPLYQNYKHIKTLQSLLGVKDHQIHSLIVFVGDSTFKTKMPPNVTYGFGYLRFIKSKTQPVFTDAEVEEIVEKIQKVRLAPSFKTHREHVAHVRDIVANKENRPNPICPKCGRRMVLRESKRGKNIGKKFWGCSGFPKCRYMDRSFL